MLCGWGVKAGMVHSICGWTCGWQVKLCDPLLTRAIPEHFRDGKGKGKGFPILSTKRWARADPGVQAVSPQMTVSHPPDGRLPLLSARPAVTSPAAEHHRPLAGIKLYCLVTEAHRCEQLAQGCYTALPRAGFEPVTYLSQVQRSTRCTTAPPAEMRWVMMKCYTNLRILYFTLQFCSVP